ncbi:hypothetical protein DW006_05540 [Eubacterium sp. AF36-5BH]|uniref:DUF6054 family protein n=1 Tax=Eubacterium sp. AF36-5BH TaxID=2293108 RepID=UPI000E4C1644|nr:DUF6054 family protein [Eubacterium sp. AF36-5BH]RGF51593.1 hypothetical protein DW006_05540 [Eubacterium sp. AF36-5BH]
MAKLEKVVHGNFDTILKKIERGIMGGSVSASLEDSSNIRVGDTRCSVRVFERYSYTGGNRVSLNVTLLTTGDDKVYVSAISAGGSKGVFLKINTFGEETFLSKLRELL